MNEKKLIKAINLIADNHEQGIPTESTIVSEELRNALARLYSIGHNKGFTQGYEMAKQAYQNYDTNAINSAIKREKERLEKEYSEAFEEHVEVVKEEYSGKINTLEKRQEKAVELLKQALEYMDPDVSQGLSRPYFRR